MPILTRSPYYSNKVFSNNFTLSINWNLKIESRESNGADLITEEDILKQVPSDDFTNLWADISPIVRDFFVHSPILLAQLQSPGVMRGRDREVLRLTTNISENDSINSGIPDVESTELCLDGYSLFEEGQNFMASSGFLLSHRSYKVSENGYFLVPFWASASDTLRVNGNPVSLTIQSPPYDSLQYLIIRAADYTGDITVELNGDELFIEKEIACKYPVKEIQFINKFGVVESIDFRAISKEMISVEKKMFNNSYTDGTSFNVHRHQKRQYQKIGSKKIMIETDFLNEDYNQTIEQLMLSEVAWIRSGNVTRPINVDTSSLEYKTRVVDKLISYSISFEYANNVINNV